MRRHPWLAAAVVFLVLLLICAGAFFAFEWRAEKRWQHYAAQARVRGVKLLLQDFERPPIPDAVNFAMLPMLQKASTDPDAPHPLKLPEKKDPKHFTAGIWNLPVSAVPSFGNPLKSEPIGWPKWQHYFQEMGYLDEKSDDPVRDVLRALEHYTPEFRQWDEWHTRTQCQFPTDAAQGVSAARPYLSVFLSAEKIFALRLRAHLALRDSAAAYVDFQDGLQAYRALRDDPRIIAGLVRVSVLHVLLAAVGEGCKDRAWTEEDARKIEADLAGIRVWDDWYFALASERGGSNTTLENWLSLSMRERGKLFASYPKMFFEAPPSEVEIWTAGLYPRGMIRDNQRLQNQYFDELLARVDTEKQTVHLDRPTPSELGTPSNRFEALHYFLTFMSQGIYKEVESRYVALQTMLDQTRLACALERFRAKRGAYPATLSELVPDFVTVVPDDIYAKAPYHYRRIGETSFQLYGVGKNRKDDGGKVSSTLSESRQLDAIWLYAPPAAIH